MKKYKFFFLFLFCFFAFTLDTFAFTVKMDGDTMTTTNYLVRYTGNSQLVFTGDTVYPDISDFPQYYLLTFCTDSNRVSSWSINNQSLSSIDYYSTNYKCSFPNSTYTGGHIVYVYGQVNPSQNCSVNLTNCYQGGNSTFYVPNQSSWALLSYQISKDTISIDYSGDTIISQNQQIINGQNSIINNNNQNTQDIIDNQNTIADEQRKNQQVCDYIDKNDILSTGKGLNSSGVVVNLSGNGTTDYIKIVGSELELLTHTDNSNANFCFYDVNKVFISCLPSRTTSLGVVELPSNSYYMRATILISENKPTFKLCTNGNQAIENTLTNDDVSEANNKANSFFLDFNYNNHGLSGIITAPLRLLNAFTSATCSPLQFNLPFVENTVVLPCMKVIYENYFGLFFSLWQLITTGLISYTVCINFYHKIKQLQDPDSDRIEVLNL